MGLTQLYITAYVAVPINIYERYPHIFYNVSGMKILQWITVL